MKIVPTVRPGRRIEKKGQDRTVHDSQKSHKGVIFHLFGEKPPEPIFTKICTVIAVPHVTKSRVQSFELKFSGVTILQGVEFPIFLLIL